MGVFVKVAEQGELADREAKLVEIEGRQIALIRSGDKYYALDNVCTHRGGPLAEGSVVGSEVECPWHGAHFDLETGEVRQPPAARGVTAYSVRLQGSDIEIEL